MLNIQTKNVDGVLHVALKGRVNTVTSKEFARRMESEIGDARGVVLDCKKLEYISSAGLRILISLAQHMQKTGGDGVRVCNANGVVLDTLEISGLGSIITID